MVFPYKMLIFSLKRSLEKSARHFGIETYNIVLDEIDLGLDGGDFMV